MRRWTSGIHNTQEAAILSEFIKTDAYMMEVTQRTHVGDKCHVMAERGDLILTFIAELYYHTWVNSVDSVELQVYRSITVDNLDVDMSHGKLEKLVPMQDFYQKNNEGMPAEAAK
jgi:hypothetical protein